MKGRNSLQSLPEIKVEKLLQWELYEATLGYYQSWNQVKTLKGKLYEVVASLVAHLVKNLPAVWETWVRSLGWEDALEKGTATHPVFWPGKFHGLYSPWGRKESDRTEQLSLSPTWTRHRNLQPIVSNQIQQCTKRNTHLNQVGFISDVQGWFNILKLIHNQQMKVKPHDYIKWCRKAFDKTHSW